MFRCLYMKRTTESKTESKLGTGLEHKTLKFTDYAIFKFQSLAIPGGLNIFCLSDRSSLGLLVLFKYFFHLICDKIFFFFYFPQQILNKIEFYILWYVSI